MSMTMFPPLHRTLTPVADGGWHRDLFGTSLMAWVLALGIAVVAFIVVHAVLRGIRRFVLPRAERSEGMGLKALAAVLSAIRAWLLLLIAIAIALSTLEFPARSEYWLRLAVIALVGIQLVLCTNRVIVTLLRRAVEPGEETPVMLTILMWICQLIVWITFVLLLLSNAGVHITAFIASLGVGGIAVALALQNILSDLFASVAIGLDKPFEPGDFIMFGDNLGTVEKVGVKSTRIASLAGEELSIGNAQLLTQLTHNYSRMPERRVVFGFTVPYSTTREQLAEITERVNGIIEDTAQVRFDRGHFTGFGADGFTFEFVYYMLDSGFVLYRDTQQMIDHRIIEVLDSLGVSFAVPARAVAMDGGIADGGRAAGGTAS